MVVIVWMLVVDEIVVFDVNLEVSGWWWSRVKQSSGLWSGKEGKLGRKLCQACLGGYASQPAEERGLVSRRGKSLMRQLFA